MGAAQDARDRLAALGYDWLDKAVVFDRDEKMTALAADLTKGRAAIEAVGRVLALHPRVERQTRPVMADGFRIGGGLSVECDSCRARWPCPTIAALGPAPAPAPATCKHCGDPVEQDTASGVWSHVVGPGSYLIRCQHTVPYGQDAEPATAGE